MPRVISYARFSSRKQAKGLSLARQIEAAEKWCKEKGYTLESGDQYKDEGRSAFNGDNAAVGALSVIQAKLVSGEIEKGTILIVEALDRVTRLPLSDAFALMMSLVKGGLVVVTLSDGKVWNNETLNDLGSFMMSIVTLYRGHQESEFKSGRLRATFNMHRKRSSQEAFGSAPGWLKREDKTEPWTVKPELAAVVQRVFELSAAGFGSKAIAHKANAEKWPVVTRNGKEEKGWHAQMPGQLLRNRAVLGEMQHRIRTHEAHAKHWQGLITGAPIENYYPRVVSDELWNRSRASVRSRAVAKRRDAHYYNVFSGLMYCGLCGAPIHRKSERTGHSHAQLQCSDKVSGKTTCKTMAANLADPTILDAIYGYAIAALGTDERDGASADLDALETAIAEKRAEAANIARALGQTKGKGHALIQLTIKLEYEIDELQQQLLELKEEQSLQPTGTVFDERFVTEAMSFLYVPDDETAKEKRAELHLKLTRVVETIWLFAYDLAVIKYKDNPFPQLVSLPHKQLPSRANPKAKYHKPPKPKPEPEKAFFVAYMAQKLELPEPRKSAAFTKKAKPLILEHDEDGEEDEYLDAA
ncbi:recombinase family protein [Janthinobacterium sp. CAN_S7]|uniref:recombinase family protein n=1 Tax=Janthinobacterium sp. CAN_S7 TaxID=3071704 RepID=UPI00319DBEEE